MLILAAASGTMYAQPIALSISVQDNFPTVVQAGDAVTVALTITGTEDGETWEAYDGAALIWTMHAVVNETLGVWEQQYLSSEIEVIDGYVEFEWLAQVEGLEHIAITIPDDESGVTAYTPPVIVDAGAPVSVSIAQFEPELALVPYDEESELVDHIGLEHQLAGSITLFVSFLDSYGNVVLISPEPDTETELEFEFEIDEQALSDRTGVSCVVELELIHVEDDGYPQGYAGQEDHTHEEPDEDGDGLSDTLERLSRYTQGAILSTAPFRPRHGSRTLQIRVVGTATAGGSIASLTPFSVSVQVSGTILGTAFSSSGQASGGIGTIGTSYHTPYLVFHDKYWLNNGTQPALGEDYYWPNLSVGQRYRFGHGGSVTRESLKRMETRMLPLISGGWNGLIGEMRNFAETGGAIGGMFFFDWMGPPATYGHIKREFEVFDTKSVDLGHNHANTNDHYGRRGWELHIAYHNNGSQKPTPSVDGYLHTYRGANAKVDSTWHPSDARVAAATWTRKSFGDEISALDDKNKLAAAENETYQITGFSVGTGGFSIDVATTPQGSATSAQLPWGEQVSTVSGQGDDIIQVGFAVAWALYAKNTGIAQQGTVWCRVAFMDYLRVADPGCPEPGQAIMAPLPAGSHVPYPVTSLSSATKQAFVRVGYSAPGTGGVVYTSAKWLKE
jgi:hypothetical protein